MLQKLGSVNLNVKKDVSNQHESYLIHRSAHLNAKKDVSNEYEPYLIYTSSAVNQTIYSRFKVMNMNLLVLHCHRN